MEGVFFNVHAWSPRGKSGLHDVLWQATKRHHGSPDHGCHGKLNRVEKDRVQEPALGPQERILDQSPTR
jgi:hypothetical protein